ncbi:MAG: transporter substrate-binding domain-containing protein [Candidatus Theseobacter exili]|nr:transporter substrate-binding domain-containing protein [Candidatus Theseobacter exili]
MKKILGNVFIYFLFFIFMPAVFCSSQDLPVESQKTKLLINLTVKEAEWLETHSTIRIGLNPDSAPLEYVDKKGMHSGMASDYLKILKNRTGLKIEILPNLTRIQIIEKAKNKDLDVISFIVPTLGSSKYVSFTEPYLTFPSVIVTGRHFPFVSGMDDLAEKKVAVIKESNLLEYFKKTHPKCVLVIMNNPEEAMKAVSNGTVEAYIDDLATVTYLINKNDYKDVKVTVGSILEKESYSLGVREDWPELLSIINKTLKGISNRQSNEIYKRWVSEQAQRENERRFFLRMIFVIGGIAIGTILLVFFWNKSLQKEISERKRVESEREKLLNLLEELNKNKNRFFSIIAHDLRSPFTVLLDDIGLLMAIESVKDPEEVREIVKKIGEDADRTYKLLNNLLQWAELQMNKIHYEPTVFDLADVAEKTLDVLQLSADAKKIDINNCLLNGTDIYADPKMMETILRNLVSNAIKFTSKGGNITLSAHPVIQSAGQDKPDLSGSGLIEISVADTGLGISHENIDKLFRMGAFSSTRGTNNEKGSGLGLELCREMVEKNGGTIRIESEMEQGTIVYFTVPIGQKVN